MTTLPPRTGPLRPERLAWVLVLCVSVPAYGSLIISGLMAERLAFPSGGMLGGDFAAFWTAARSLADGGYPGIYDSEAFEAALHGLGAARERFGLTWQYPPHAMLVLAPLAQLPYVSAYLAFVGVGLAAFAAALRGAGGVPWPRVGLALASPALFQVVVCGQMGAITGALMLGALLLPGSRPVAAGLCAALLTIKPQLGVLIPIAYIAGGHWRAFGVASAATLALVAASFLVFGASAWSAFVDQILGVTRLVGEAAYPLPKMITVFAALRGADLPEGLAGAAQGLVGVGAMILCWRIWRSDWSAARKAAVTSGLAFLCTPYAYYYDVAVLAFAFLLAARGASLAAPTRLAALGLCFMAPLWMVGPFSAVGAALGLSAVLLLTALAADPDLLTRSARPERTASA